MLCGGDLLLGHLVFSAATSQTAQETIPRELFLELPYLPARSKYGMLALWHRRGGRRLSRESVATGTSNYILYYYGLSLILAFAKLSIGDLPFVQSCSL